MDISGEILAIAIAIAISKIVTLPKLKIWSANGRNIFGFKLKSKYLKFSETFAAVQMSF